jgi:hypothetical protein
MIQSNEQKHAEIQQRLRDTGGVTAALKRAARDALDEHARAGQKIVVWRDDQVVWEEVQMDRMYPNNRASYEADEA